MQPSRIDRSTYRPLFVLAVWVMGTCPLWVVASPLPARTLETVIVIADEPSEEQPVQAVVPDRDGRLSTITDLFRGSPGIIAEGVFGGIDHPRLAVRGSGLQRGTQPAGRGIELRLDGVPMTYADTSYDFVEWVDPLMFGSVRILRGGRGVQKGGAALGGVIDFRAIAPGADGGSIRAEAGSFGHRRGKLLGGFNHPSFAAVGTATRFQMDGYRNHNHQVATRSYTSAKTTMGDLGFRATALTSRSELALPGPQTLADIRAGRRAAQPGNVAGDWRRHSSRDRITLGLDWPLASRTLSADLAWMNTDTDFRRRDVQVESNQDVALVLRLADGADPRRDDRFGLELVWQDGHRDSQLHLNGGGTIPTFTGQRGRLWADSRFDASRFSLVGNWSPRLDGPVGVDLHLGWNHHTREIRERFPVRAARPAAEFDRNYAGFSALALATWQQSNGIEFFAAASRIVEPPAFDVIYINVAGTGAGNALVDGPNPRRPVIRDIDAQTAITLESGVRGALGLLDFDATVYRSWLRREIVSTSDFVSQTIMSVGNADQTTRFGIEASASATIAEGLVYDDDQTRFAFAWTWTDARFIDDVQFGDNQLPIVAPHQLEARIDYWTAFGWYGGPFMAWVPRGGWADYANTLRDDGYLTLGFRAGWQSSLFDFFIEGRNLTDVRRAGTVITAQNNLGGRDAATFAPVEGRAWTVGIEQRF